MKNITLLLLFSLGIYQASFSQGCIVVRNISGFGQYNLSDNAFSSANWLVNLNNRYFKSFRDFRGTTDLKTPAANEAVNNVYTFEIGVGRILRNGWSLNLDAPITSNSREASLEHGGPNTTRHTTRSFGIGDIRFTVYKWLLAPSVSQKFNVQLGLGLKLPTGNYKYEDYFYRNDTTRVLAPVNPSIQLGDGGTGLITELNTFYIVNYRISFYGNLYYMFNPREQNGVSPLAGRAPTSVQINSGSTETSVPDQYSMRAGAYYNFKKLALSFGVRNEGIPVKDAIGGSNGIRRAGHNLSVEPGVLLKMKKATLYTYVPIIVSRKISQNVPDKLVSKLTNTSTISPGGSGNYLVFLGVLFKL